MTASASRRALFAMATSARLERAVKALPPLHRLARRLSRRYVAGTTLDDALHCAHTLASEGLTASIDLFGERTIHPADADAVAAAYLQLAAGLEHAPPTTWLSLDLSHLGIAADPEGALHRLQAIVNALAPGRRLQIGAEDAELTGRVLDTVCAVAQPSRLTATIQANLRRSPGDADRLADADIPIRLVKGAYIEGPEVALPYGEPTDLAYLALAEQLAARRAHVLLATHHGLLREACRRSLPDAPIEMLLGVRTASARNLAGNGVPVRIYIPYGPGWFRYAMRRAAEARGP